MNPTARNEVAAQPHQHMIPFRGGSLGTSTADRLHGGDDGESTAAALRVTGETDAPEGTRHTPAAEGFSLETDQRTTS
jgi:hypothetical protein